MAMNEAELLDGISRAMTTTVQTVDKLESLLKALAQIGSHVEGVADQVNCMAMNVALEALKAEQSGATLSRVAEEADLLEIHVLTALLDVSQRVEGLIRALHWPGCAAPRHVNSQR